MADTWVRQQPKPHQCEPPIAEHARGELLYLRPTPSGRHGDLWRCGDCRDLWRIGLACESCERYGEREHLGLHSVGLAWRPARLRDYWYAWWTERRWRHHTALGGGRDG